MINSTQGRVTIGSPERVFDSEALGWRITVRGSRGYDVSPDGTRILVQTPGLEGTPTISIIDNLQAWLRSRR